MTTVKSRSVVKLVNIFLISVRCPEQVKDEPTYACVKGRRTFLGQRSLQAPADGLTRAASNSGFPLMLASIRLAMIKLVVARLCLQHT